MQLGIEKTKKTFVHLTAIACDGVALIKHRKLSRLLDLAVQVKGLVQDAPLALPELKDLDAQEASDVAAQAYLCFKAIFDELKK